MNKHSTYLFNYRYSTLALITPLLPPEAGLIGYQDLSFRCDFPTDRVGVFLVWGLGALDSQKHEAENNIDKWEDQKDKEEYQNNSYMDALGVKKLLKRKMSILFQK